MSCITLTTLDVSMATTQFTRANCTVYWPSIEENTAVVRPPLMNWVVVTDEQGQRQLRMQWKPVT